MTLDDYDKMLDKYKALYVTDDEESSDSECQLCKPWRHVSLYSSTALTDEAAGDILRYTLINKFQDSPPPLST